MEAKKNMLEVQYTSVDERLRILDRLWDQSEATINEFSKHVSSYSGT